MGVSGVCDTPKKHPLPASAKPLPAAVETSIKPPLDEVLAL